MAVCIIKTKVLSMGSYLKDQEQLSCIAWLQKTKKTEQKTHHTSAKAPCESTLQTNKASAIGRENKGARSEGSLKLSSG